MNAVLAVKILLTSAIVLAIISMILPFRWQERTMGFALFCLACAGVVGLWKLTPG